MKKKIFYSFLIVLLLLVWTFTGFIYQENAHFKKGNALMKDFWINYEEARASQDHNKLAQLISPSFVKCFEEEVSAANDELDCLLQPLIDTISMPEYSDKFLLFSGMIIKMIPTSPDISYTVSTNTLSTRLKFLNDSGPAPLVLELTFSRNKNGIRVECIDGFREILVLRHQVLFS